MSSDVICWPTKAPVCLAVYEDSGGGAVGNPYLRPRNLDWRKGASETYWSMAPSTAEPRMTPDAYYGIEVVGDPVDHRIRILWPWTRDAAPTHVLQCYDCGGAAKNYAPESIAATTLTQSDPERSVFTYLLLEPADDGRQRVALRCPHGRLAQVSRRFEHPALTARLVNEPGVAITIDQPVHRTWVDVVRVHAPHVPTPRQPAVDYRAALVNPTSEVLQKQFTFTHEKATTGTWNNEVGMSLSVGASVSVGASAFGAEVSAEYHWEMTAEASRSWGGSAAETQTVQDATTVSVPGNTALDIHILTERQRVDVPFEYVIHRIGLDGEELEPVHDTGVWEKVETLGSKVTIENVTPCPVPIRAKPTATRSSRRKPSTT